MEIGSNKALGKGGKNEKRAKVKHLLQNGVLVCSSLILFLSLLEVLFRIMGYGNLIIYEPDQKLFWKPLPNQDCFTKFGHKPIHINSKGTRGRDFEEVKPPKVYRILSLGDSRTFGWGLSEPETYSGLLESLLQKHVGDNFRIEVINAGVNAWSYSQIHTYLRDIGIRYKPDMVILADANLWTEFSEDKSKEFIDKFLKRVYIKNLLRRSAIYHYFIEYKLEKYYQKYRTKFIPIDPDRDKKSVADPQSSPWDLFEKQIANILELIENERAKGVIIYIPTRDWIKGQERPKILEIKEKICEKYNFLFIDLTGDFKVGEKEWFLQDDPVHPNIYGNKLIANRLFQFVVRDLEFSGKD